MSDVRPPLALGLEPATARRIGADLQTRLEPYPHGRARVMQALSGAKMSADQLGMALKLGLHRRDVIAGVTRALVDHRKASASRAIESLGKSL